MAKMIGWPGDGKRPALSGKLIYQTDRGQLKVQSWPRKRGKPKSAITRAQNEKFRQANLLAKYAPSDDQWMTIEVAKGSPWYPRDLLMSAMYGRLFEVLIIEGQEYRAVAVNEDVSSDLDFLAGTVEGTIIVKSQGLWTKLLPGAVDFVITSNGPDSIPAWKAASAAGGDFLVNNVPSNATSGSLAATKGNAFQVVSAITIKGIGIRLLATNAHTYRGSVYELDGSSNIAAILAQTSPVTGLPTGLQGLFGLLATAPTLIPGKVYVIAWSRTDGTDTFVFPTMGTLTPKFFPGFPEEFYAVSSNVDNFVLITKANPTVGDAAPISTGGRFHGKYLLSL